MNAHNFQKDVISSLDLDKYRAVPAIATAATLYDEQSQEAGCDGHLVKPVNFPELETR